MNVSTTSFITAALFLGYVSAEQADTVKPVVPMQAFAFPLEQVRLLEGPFKHAMELDRKYLLSLDTDRLLHVFRVNAGIPSASKPLAGWEAPNCELRGHFVGHYLSACALMYASTGDEAVKTKGDAVVKGLIECQAKLGEGYLSAFPLEFLDRVENKKEVWAPYYTLHKLYAGLLDMAVHTGNQEALASCKKYADWLIARNAKLSDVQMQKMLTCEHGGMTDVLAKIYAVTGEKKYLEIAKRFNHELVLGPAKQKQDKLTGLHANTQIPKFIGAAREFELTGDESLKTAALFFWETVVKERSYVIGGNSDGEYFTHKEKLSTAFGECTTETCNTHNMLKLTRHLFMWNPRADYADYYERALYNHILASQDPVTGGMCYYVPLRSGMRKTYGGELDAFWCCTGTGIESHAKYGDSIYFHDAANALFVNLFIASELNWREKGVLVRQETRFPDEPCTRLLFTCAAPTELSLKLRHPSWARSGFEIKVNNEKQAIESQPGSYAVVKRTWKTGDTLEIVMPFNLHTEGFRDNPKRFAFLNGPLVLCAQVTPKQLPPAVVGTPEQACEALRPLADRVSNFTGPAEIFRLPGAETKEGITLEPFFRMHGGRHYMVYFDAFTPEAWAVKEMQYTAEMAARKALEARLVDRVNPGEDQNERDHKLAGEHHKIGEEGGLKCRQAKDGWFAWTLAVKPGKPHELRVTYWGSDASGHDFDVLVEGEKVKTEKLHGKKPGETFDENYAIPANLTEGKSSLTIRFQAHPGSTAGGVFSVLMLAKE